MKFLIINRADGGVSITPLTEEYLVLLDAAAEEHIALPEIRQWEGVASPDWLPIKGWHITDEPPPSDRTFRNAWVVLPTGRFVDFAETTPELGVVIDMPKAREIWRDKMRLARKPLLEGLDTEYQKADEVANSAAKADVTARKQVLRDVTADPAIEAAKTPDELKAVWPGCLK